MHHQLSCGIRSNPDGRSVCTGGRVSGKLKSKKEKYLFVADLQTSAIFTNFYYTLLIFIFIFKSCDGTGLLCDTHRCHLNSFYLLYISLFNMY